MNRVNNKFWTLPLFEHSPVVGKNEDEILNRVKRKNIARLA